MNVPAPSSERIPYSRRIAAQARSAQHAPPIVILAHDMHRAANAETATSTPASPVNPLWMITAAVALFFAAMALIISS